MKILNEEADEADISTKQPKRSLNIGKSRSSTKVKIGTKTHKR